MIHAPKRTGRDFEVSAADGVRIRGTRYDGGANRLVLVHSLAMDRGFWNRAIEHLPAEWSIIAFDCRGHGASNKPGGAYAIETFGDDVAAVLDFAGWPSAVIAGASMGGCVTLAFAARHPARAQGLGLFDTTAWYGADAPAAWEKRACAAEQEGIASLIDFQVTRWFTEEFRKTHPDVAKSCVDVFVANDIPAYAATCRMLGRANLTDSLQKFAMPVRIVVGEEDYATPISMAQTLQSHIDGSTLRIVPRARHLSPVEVPETIAAELIALFDTLESRART